MKSDCAPIVPKNIGWFAFLCGLCIGELNLKVGLLLRQGGTLVTGMKADRAVALPIALAWTLGWHVSDPVASALAAPQTMPCANQPGAWSLHSFTTGGLMTSLTFCMRHSRTGVPLGPHRHHARLCDCADACGCAALPRQQHRAGPAQPVAQPAAKHTAALCTRAGE